MHNKRIFRLGLLIGLMGVALLLLPGVEPSPFTHRPPLL
jgi:hypothetical protein